MLKKVLVWAGISSLIFFIAFRPGAVIDVVRALGNMLIDVGNAIGKVLT